MTPYPDWAKKPQEAPGGRTGKEVPARLAPWGPRSHRPTQCLPGLEDEQNTSNSLTSVLWTCLSRP